MDILFDLVIESCLRQGDSYTVNKSYSLTNIDFFNSKSEALENIEKPKVLFKENYALRIKIQSEDKNTYFYSDIMDVIPDGFFNRETINEKNVFYESDKYRYLYDFSNSKEESYSMIVPGKYLIEVTTYEGNYYTIMEISPIHLVENQLEVMRTEVEKYSFEMAKDFKRSALGIINNENENINKEVTYVIQNADNLIQSIMSIIDFPDSEIKKIYFYQSLLKEKKKNFKTIQSDYKKPNQYNKGFTYKNTLIYDTSYNRSLKLIVDSLGNIVMKQLVYLKNYAVEISKDYEKQKRYKNSNLTSLKKEQEKIKIYITKLGHIQQALFYLEKQTWFSEVLEINSIEKANKLILKRNYSVLFKAYTDIRKGIFKDEVNLVAKYGYYWRETSTLYEVWGILKIIDILKQSKFGFKEMSNPENKKWVMHFENNVRIEILYDAIVPKASANDLIFIDEKHNRPDLRVDIFKTNQYVQTLIGDFKYRNPNSRYLKETNLHSQLKAYGNIKVNSKKGENISLKELFAMFPKPNIDKKMFVFVKFISLIPGEENKAFKEFLIASVDALLNPMEKEISDIELETISKV